MGADYSFNPKPGEWIAARDNDEQPWWVVQFVEMSMPGKFICKRHYGSSRDVYEYRRGKSLSSFNNEEKDNEKERTEFKS